MASMAAPAVQPRQTSSMTWMGRIVSTLVTAFMLADGLTGVLAPEKLRQVAEQTGFAFSQLGAIGWIAVVCAVVYAVPWSAVLGAILITGFCGGAICTHFRLGEVGAPPQLICLALAAAAWGGLVLREPRLRSLLLPGASGDR